jgi:hypothetical protein
MDSNTHAVPTGLQGWRLNPRYRLVLHSADVAAVLLDEVEPLVLVGLDVVTVLQLVDAGEAGRCLSGKQQEVVNQLILDGILIPSSTDD